MKDPYKEFRWRFENDLPEEDDEEEKEPEEDPEDYIELKQEKY